MTNHTQPSQQVPVAEIALILNQVMEIAVKNGANSVSMPDEYVAVAHWLCFPHEYVAQSPAASDAGLADDAKTVALKAAQRFIRNGIELGYIRMPDADMPDPAHDTLPLIEAALASQEPQHG